MTEEAQRIALAEACGWHSFRDIKGDDETRLWGMSRTMRQTSLPTELVPDYLHSLDAMREAEKVLTPAQQLTFYRYLVDAGDRNRDGTQRFGQTVYWETVHATAAVKAAAILRTLNLWDDTK